MLTFTNPGTVSREALFTLGVNAKPADATPIGFFGTGFKYAVAITLRLGHTLIVHSGSAANPETFTFSTRSITVRDKSFSLITASINNGPATDLGFTTEFGKHWEPWMVVRELAANALDEGGSWSCCAAPEPSDNRNADSTTIHLTGFDQIYRDRSRYFLEPAALSKPIASTPNVTAHIGSGIFLAGIRVSFEKTRFAYNFQPGGLQLTEDRTIADMWRVQYRIISLLEDESIQEYFLREWVSAPSDSLEARTHFYSPQESLLSRLRKFQRTGLTITNTSLKTALTNYHLTTSPTPITLTPVEKATLSRAKAGLTPLFNPDTYPILVVEALPSDALGLAKPGASNNRNATADATDTIYLSRRVLGMGTKMVAGTIYEEYMHLTHNLADESRDFQNRLIDQIMSLLEELSGHPF